MRSLPKQMKRKPSNGFPRKQIIKQNRHHRFRKSNILELTSNFNKFMKTPIVHTTFPNFIRTNHNKNKNVVTVHLGTKILLLPASEITYLQGDGNYTFVYTIFGKRYLVSKTMKTIQGILDTEFLRIHKSYMINPGHLVSRIDIDRVLLSCGQQLPIARRRISVIQELLAGEYLRVG
jgi:two-component system LytT family response regulator